METPFTVGVGFTVIVKLLFDPLHPFATGVTVNVAFTGLVPRLTPANEPIFPLPLPANPIDGKLLVQLNTVPLTLPAKLTAVVLAPLQIA